MDTIPPTESAPTEPLSWTPSQRAGLAKRTEIVVILEKNHVGHQRALQASLNEFRNWEPSDVAELFSGFPPLEERRLYPLGPECRYPPPGRARWTEFAAKVAVLAVADAVVVATAPVTWPLMERQKRNEVVQSMKTIHQEAWAGSVFVGCGLDLMEEAGRQGAALCVDRRGRFRIMKEGYAAISHVWAETMGLQYQGEKIEQDERGLLKAHFDAIMGKAEMSGYEWFWFDLLAIPKKPADGTRNQRQTEAKTTIINSLQSVYRNAEVVIVFDALPLNLSSGDPLKVAAVLVCGLWLTRVWTYQEAKLAHKALIMTATNAVSFQDILQAAEKQANLDRAKWYEIHRTFARLQPIYGPGINLADIALSCTNRYAEHEVDYARGFFALLGLQWQPGWSYEDGIAHIYQARPQEAAMIAAMHAPRGLPRPYSWAPKYLTQLQGRAQRPFHFSCTGSGLIGSWHTATVRELVRACTYGSADHDRDDKMAFQLKVEEVAGGELVLVTVVTWGSGWTEALRSWTALISSGKALIICPSVMAVGGDCTFPIVLLVSRTHDNVGQVFGSGVFVGGTLQAFEVRWNLL